MSEDIGIDLGTATIIAYSKGKGVVLREPTVVSINKDTNEVIAYGKEAHKMLGRNPSNIEVIKPLKDGVISNLTVTSKMLKYFIKKIMGKKLLAPRLMICVPSQVTEVEKKAVIDVANSVGAKKVYLIEEPIAAAIGAGIDISKPSGNLVIDIGGGTTDIAVISICGAVVSTSIKTAGNKFDEAIIKYVKKKYKTLIGERTAEEIKKAVGCVYPKNIKNKDEEYNENSDKIENSTITVRGRSVETGLPIQIELNDQEMLKGLVPDAIKIVEAVKATIEKAPPELIEDISEKGIYMTGGGSLLYGIDRLLQESTGIKVMIAQDAVSCVAIGTGKALDNLAVLENKLKK